MSTAASPKSPRRYRPKRNTCKSTAENDPYDPGGHILILQTEPPGSCHHTDVLVLLIMVLQAEQFLSAKNQSESKYGNRNFSDGSHCKRTQALFAHVSEIGPQTNSCKG